MEKIVKRVICFDFDDTLMYTSLPDTPYKFSDGKTGKEIYKDKTGEEWPHKGWWGREESLNMEIFEIGKNEYIYNKYLEAKQMPDTMVIMMTGRIPKLRHLVEDILEHNNMEFDRYYYNNIGDTYKFKTGVFENIIGEFSDTIEHLTMYDDRIEHVVRFDVWAKELEKKTGVDIDVIQVI